MEEKKNTFTEEKILKPKSGLAMLLLLILGLAASIGLFILGVAAFEEASGVFIAAGILLFTVCCIAFPGLKVINEDS